METDENTGKNKIYPTKESQDNKNQRKHQYGAIYHFKNK